MTTPAYAQVYLLQEILLHMKAALDELADCKRHCYKFSLLG